MYESFIPKKYLLLVHSISKHETFEKQEKKKSFQISLKVTAKLSTCHPQTARLDHVLISHTLM